MILQQLEDVIKAVISAGLFGCLIVLGFWIKKKLDLRNRVKLNEITLTNSRLVIEKKNSILTDDALRDKLDTELKK